MSGRDNDREGELLEALAYMLASDVLEDAAELEAELADMGGRLETVAEGLLAEARTKISQQRRESLGTVREDEGFVIADEPTAYAEVRDDELDQLWSARTKGMESGPVAVAHRELRGVSVHDKRTMQQDLDLLDEEETTNGDDE